MNKIIPAIMPDDYNDLVDKISLVDDLVKEVQIDVMDGKFVSSISWPYKFADGHFEKMKRQDEGLPSWQKLDFEIDLMVNDPKKEAMNWIEVGALRLIFHVESFNDEDSVDFLNEIKEKYNLEIGIAISPSTSNDVLDKYLEVADTIQFMGIENVGFQGEEFVPDVLNKIRDLRAKNPDIEISVDGGVNLENASQLLEAGATRLVSGSALFNSEDIEETLRGFESV